MCPDPTLLVGYRDGTLFSRDVIAVERHLAGCAECAAMLAAMQREREAERRSARVSLRTIGAAGAGIAIMALGAWLVLPGSREALPREVSPAPTVPVSAAAVAERPAAPPAAAPAPEAPAAAAAPVASTTSRPKPAATPRSDPAADRSPREAPAVESFAVAPVEEPILAPADVGVTLRGRRAARRTLWRVRDLVIEHSIDGGATWAAEHTADRPVRAGALVDANVAWLVGENGLVLRRTKNGWFGATPPADGTITAVRASSSSKATVTLDDGRSFTTENGGATWSEQ